MELHKFTGTGSGSFEIEQASQSMIMLNVAKGAKIRIDQISDKESDVNIFPELTVEQYVNFFNTAIARPLIVETNADGTAYTRVVFPLSINGALILSEDLKYKVSMSGLSNRTTTIHNADSTREGTPIRVTYNEIKATLQEQVIDTTNVDALFFPNGNPNKIETFVSTIGANGAEKRKVEISAEQLETWDLEQRITGVELGLDSKSYVVGNRFNTLPIDQMQSVTMHKNAGEVFSFYEVKIQ